MLRPILTLLSVVLLSHAAAQELWLHPEQYFYEPNATAKVQLLGGDEFMGTPVPLASERVESLSLSYAGRETDLTKAFKPGPEPSFDSRLFGEGIYFFMLKIKPELSWVDANGFTDFIKQYDLENIAVPLNGVDSLGVSLRHFLKAYVRVGTDFDRRAEKTMGLPLEIIPDKNPLVLERGEKITFTVVKNGKPAFGMRVRIWNRWNRRTTIQHIYTQQDGTVSTTISSPGDWMVTVVDLTSDGKDSLRYSGEMFALTFGFR